MIRVNATRLMEDRSRFLWPRAGSMEIVGPGHHVKGSTGCSSAGILSPGGVRRRSNEAPGRTPIGEALVITATEEPQRLALLLGLDALGDELHAHVAAERGDGLDYLALHAALVDV